MDDLRQKIEDIIAAKTGKRPRPDQSWWELDIDSIVMAEMIHELEQHLGMRLNEQVFETENVAELAELVAQLRDRSVPKSS